MVGKIIGEIKTLVEIQGQPGAWNYDSYMHGMYNGMELILSMLENREPIFREAPAIWGKDIEIKDIEPIPNSSLLK